MNICINSADLTGAPAPPQGNSSSDAPRGQKSEVRVVK